MHEVMVMVVVLGRSGRSSASDGVGGLFMILVMVGGVVAEVLVVAVVIMIEGVEMVEELSVEVVCGRVSSNFVVSGCGDCGSGVGDGWQSW